MENKLVIERIVKAPRGKVWSACSDRAQLQQWWGQPKGATMPICELDFRVGGVLYFKVVLPGGEAIWGKSIYKEIVEGERIVMEDHYSNEQGDMIDSAELPASTITLTLEDVEGGGEITKLTIVHEGIGIGIHTIEQYKEGWAQVLDRLEETLSVKK